MWGQHEYLHAHRLLSSRPLKPTEPNAAKCQKNVGGEHPFGTGLAVEIPDLLAKGLIEHNNGQAAGGEAAK
jgi:hypothetical protein